MTFAVWGAGSGLRPLDDTNRFGLVETDSVPDSPSAGSAAVRSLGSGAGAFLAAAFFVAFLAAFLAGGFLVETTFFDAVASSAISVAWPLSEGGLTKPSRLAFLRTRSAWASTMLEE